MSLLDTTPYKTNQSLLEVTLQKSPRFKSWAFCIVRGKLKQYASQLLFCYKFALIECQRPIENCFFSYMLFNLLIYAIINFDQNGESKLDVYSLSSSLSYNVKVKLGPPLDWPVEL